MTTKEQDKSRRRVAVNDLTKNLQHLKLPAGSFNENLMIKFEKSSEQVQVCRLQQIYTVES